MTLKPCLSCGEPSDATRCPDCAPSHDTQRRPDRDRVTNRGPWVRLSKRLRRIQPWCSTCGSTTDLTVDHIIPWSERPDLEFELSNLDVLCRTCNGIKGDRSQADTPTTRGGTPPEAPSRALDKAHSRLRMVLNRDGGA